MQLGLPRVLQVRELAAEPGLVHGFSTLQIGSLGLAHAPDPTQIQDNRQAFAQALGFRAEMVTIAGAVHGAAVGRIDQPVGVADGVDALVTDQVGVPLFATYADCFPILLFSPQPRCIGLVHAGWRGTEAGVTMAAVAALKSEFGCPPDTIRAGIGPGICRRCYEVGPEVADRFTEEVVDSDSRGRLLLDLAAANRLQLIGAGVRREWIHQIGLCTKETAYLPSHRRSPDGARFGCLIALVDPVS